MQITTHPQYPAGLFFGELGGKQSPITHCAETFFVRGHWVAPHAHEGFEFIYLSRGTATRYARGKRVKQKMGDLYVTYPRENHRVACEPTEEGRQIQIGLRLDQLGRKGARLAQYLQSHRTRVVQETQLIEPILQAVISQIVMNLPNRDEAILAYLDTFCVLVEQASVRVNQPAESATGLALPYSYLVQKALFFMKRNLDRRVPLNEIAAAAAASNICRFCTQFHREVGISPSAYHLQLRLDAARQALLQSSLDITSIAMQYGFCSSQHFWNAFRREFKVSPRAWRQSHQAGGSRRDGN